MIAIALIILGLSITSIYSLVNPVLMPAEMVSLITYGLSLLWGLADFLPMAEIINIFWFDVYVIGGIVLFKLLFGFLSGKPEIN